MGLSAIPDAEHKEKRTVRGTDIQTEGNENARTGECFQQLPDPTVHTILDTLKMSHFLSMRILSTLLHCSRFI